MNIPKEQKRNGARDAMASREEGKNKFLSGGKYISLLRLCYSNDSAGWIFVGSPHGHQAAQQGATTENTGRTIK